MNNKDNKTKFFYRIGKETTEGLWYDKKGNFIGLIHDNFSWLTASALQMPFEKELVGYLSVADSLEHLYSWFSKAEIQKLQLLGFNVMEYVAEDWKFYERYQHNVINEKTSIIYNKLILM